MVLSLFQKYYNRISLILSVEKGVTFVSVVILVAVISLSIWASLVLSDVILKAKSVGVTEDEIEIIANGLFNFYRDCDQFITDSGDLSVDFLDLEAGPATSRFEGTVSLQDYRQRVWDGPYVKGGYDVDKDGDTVDYIDDYLRDGWNTPYIYNYTAGASSATITSYGLNRVAGGGDDIVVTVTAGGIIEEKIRETKEELSYINAKKDELKARYENVPSEDWPPSGFDIDDLFSTYGASTTGLVSHWEMDESSWNGTAGEVVDSAGSNEGVRAGDAITDFKGKLGRCGTFDGTGDYVNCGSDSSLDNENNISVEFWIKTSYDASFPGEIGIVKKGTGSCVGWSDPGWSFRLRDDIPAWALRKKDDSGYYDLYSGAKVIDGQWHHIVGTFNTSTIKKYVDGVLTQEGNTNQAYLTTNGDCEIGRIGAYFNGYIDEVRIWSRALTSDDVFLEYLRGNYLTDWSYKYDEWQSAYAWDGTNDFYSYGPDRLNGTADDIYQSE